VGGGAQAPGNTARQINHASGQRMTFPFGLRIRSPSSFRFHFLDQQHIGAADGRLG
jgi:hypothetical protein